MKKGFTLIELLAVIVILVIILLVITPVIISVIDDARKGAFEATARGLAKTVENEYMKRAVQGNAGHHTYIFEDYEQVVGDPLAFSGQGPRSGYIYVTFDGRIGMILEDGNWVIRKEIEESGVSVEPFDDHDLEEIFDEIIDGYELELVAPILCQNDYWIDGLALLIYFTHATNIIESYLHESVSEPGEFYLLDEDAPALETDLNNIGGLVEPLTGGFWELYWHGLDEYYFGVGYQFEVGEDTNIWTYEFTFQDVYCQGVMIP